MIFDQKSILARLFAKENLQVHISPQAKTAGFDIKDRILILPNWENLTNYTYNLLVSHEAAHALWTPHEWWENKNWPFPLSFLNCIEDIRIEKNILEEYPGLYVDYINGYKDLIDRDFFGLTAGNKKISHLGFMDRLNIHAKTRGYIKTPFSVKEKPYLDMAMGVKTWADVKKVTDIIYKWLKEEKSKGNTSDIEFNGNLVISGGAEGEGSESNSDSNSLKGNSSSNTSDGKSDKNGLRPIESNMRFDIIITQEMFDNKLEQSAKVDTSHVFVDFLSEKNTLDVVETPQYQAGPPTIYDSFMSTWNPFIESLVQEFNMKKAAERLARGEESTLGSLDTSKLHRYKLTDEIFKQHTSYLDDKNHGAIFLVDYSGSMGPVISETRAQLLILAEFCRRVNIPFEAYAFSSVNAQFPGRPTSSALTLHAKAASLDVRGMKHILLLSSSMKKEKYDVARNDLLHGESKHSHLGGTPLSESLYLMHEHVFRFKRKHKLDKVSFISITDGDGHRPHFRNRGGSGSIKATKYTMMSKETNTNINTSADKFDQSLLKNMSANGIKTLNFFINTGPGELKKELTRTRGYDIEFVFGAKRLKDSSSRIRLGREISRELMKLFC
jgi:hypothetical protein